MQKLFFNKKEKAYYFVCRDNEINAHCTHCEKVIEVSKHIFIHKSYSKKEKVVENYCAECIKHHKKRIYDEFIVARVTTQFPADSILIPEFPPSLKTTNMSNILSVQEVQKMMAKGEHIENNCRFAFDPNRNKMVDFREYNLEESEKLEEKRRKHITMKELNKELKLINEATPLIPETKKKLLKDEQKRNHT
jgi:hypothetical protein